MLCKKYCAGGTSYQSNLVPLSITDRTILHASSHICHCQSEGKKSYQTFYSPLSYSPSVTSTLKSGRLFRHKKSSLFLAGYIFYFSWFISAPTECGGARECSSGACLSCEEPAGVQPGKFKFSLSWLDLFQQLSHWIRAGHVLAASLALVAPTISPL